jgi:hypothetical protein
MTRVVFIDTTAVGGILIRELKLPLRAEACSTKTEAASRTRGIAVTISRPTAGGIVQLLTGRLLVDKKQTLPRYEIKIGHETQSLLSDD